MDSVSGERGWTRARTWAELDQRLSRSLAAAGPPLLFGLRIWASLCLALYLAFWLQLDNAGWAGTTALIVCQPQLGASLRKGWYRLIGTVIGAVMIVVVTALFRRLPSKLDISIREPPDEVHRGQPARRLRGTDKCAAGCDPGRRHDGHRSDRSRAAAEIGRTFCPDNEASHG